MEYLGAPLVIGILVVQTCASRDPRKSDEASARTREREQGEALGDTPPGACSQRDRSENVHDPNVKFIGQVRACSKETWANKVKNTACLTKAVPSLSQGCAGCFADMASCALANCKMPCMFSSTSDGCNKCANSNCQASLVRCTGVASADLP